MIVKICGITTANEAEYLNKVKIDLAGMVLFFEKSKRNITIDKAKEIMKTLDDKIKTVAVVVSPTIDQIEEIENAGFDYIQIHGEMPDGVDVSSGVEKEDGGGKDEEKIIEFVRNARKKKSNRL